MLAIAFALLIQPCASALAGLAGHAAVQPPTIASQPQPTGSPAGTDSNSASADHASHQIACCESACEWDITSIRSTVRLEDVVHPYIDEQITTLFPLDRLSGSQKNVEIQPLTGIPAGISPILHRITPLII